MRRDSGCYRFPRLARQGSWKIELDQDPRRAKRGNVMSCSFHIQRLDLTESVLSSTVAWLLPIFHYGFFVRSFVRSFFAESNFSVHCWLGKNNNRNNKLQPYQKWTVCQIKRQSRCHSLAGSDRFDQKNKHSTLTCPRPSIAEDGCKTINFKRAISPRASH